MTEIADIEEGDISQRKRDNPEYRLQTYVVDYLSGEVRGSGRSKVKFQKPFDIGFTHLFQGRWEEDGFFLKELGVMAGMPDLFIWWKPRQCGFIELKVDSALSPAQFKVKGLLEDSNHRHAVCRSVAQVRDTLISWGLECRYTMVKEPPASRAEQMKAYMEAMRP